MSDTETRDQLAQIIAKHIDCDVWGSKMDCGMDYPSPDYMQFGRPEHLADAILAAGFRPPVRTQHLGELATDPDVEATYITLTMVSRYGRTVEFEGQTLLDLDPDGHLIGVELIGAVEPKEDE